jgi:hypothetical protein
LKDCPKGTKLYSPICGNCKILKIYNGLGLDVINDTDEVFNFSYDGRYNLNGECCIFPSKDNRDWNTFRPFKDGDIIAKDEFIVIFSHSKHSEVKILEQIVYYHCYLRGSSHFKSTKDCGVGYISDFRFATNEEKQKLFNAIKENGYKWNSETKTLEKLIIPKFKVGDKIVKKNSISNSYIVNSVSFDYYGLALPDRTGVAVLNVYEQDDWELVPNKFDISTLKAYDKVLVRDTNEQVWVADLFSHALVRPLGNYTFACVGDYPNQCIPYLGNEHLLGTCDDCGEYYKNW